MPFEDLETVTNENAPPTATLSYLRHIKGDNVAKRAHDVLLAQDQKLANVRKIA